MALKLEFLSNDAIPLDASPLTPDRLREKSIDEIKRLRLWKGNRQVEVGACFQVTGSADAQLVHWSGELKNVDRIGHQMKAGKMQIESTIGHHGGSGMTGGEIQINGQAGNFLGAEMQGGIVRVTGNAGDDIGAPYPGAKCGMNRGLIFVAGDVGNRVGNAMRRGMIVVVGNAGDLIGWNMRAGTIIVCGDCGASPGIGMIRGSMVIGGKNNVPTSFNSVGQTKPAMLALMFRWLLKQNVELPARLWKGDFEVLAGDGLHGNRGEMIRRI